MKIIRAIDLAAQIVIIVQLIILLIQNEEMGAAAAFGLLGIWQLVSALINTFFFYHYSLSVKIKIYWSAAVISILLCFVGTADFLSVAGIISASLTATWYIFILINLIKVVNKESKTIPDSKPKSNEK